MYHCDSCTFCEQAEVKLQRLPLCLQRINAAQSFDSLCELPFDTTGDYQVLCVIDALDVPPFASTARLC